VVYCQSMIRDASIFIPEAAPPERRSDPANDSAAAVLAKHHLRRTSIT
jgi:hypothetical protein